MTQPSWKPSMTIMDLIRQLGQQPQYSPQNEVEPQYQTPNMQPWQIEMALRRQGKDLGEGLYGRIPQGTTASGNTPLAQTGPPAPQLGAPGGMQPRLMALAQQILQAGSWQGRPVASPEEALAIASQLMAGVQAGGPGNVPAGPYQRPMQPQQGPSFVPPRGLAGTQNVQLPGPSRGEDYYNQGRIDFSKQPPPGTTNLYDLVRWGQDPNVRFQNFTPPGLPGSQIPSRGMVEPMGRMPQEPTANGTVPRTRVSAQPAGRPSSMILSDALKKAIAEAQARRQQGKNQKQKARQAINPYRAK